MKTYLPNRLAVVGLLFALAILPASPAAAHTKVDKSVPADGATLTDAPQRIELQFAGKMRLTVIKITRPDTAAAITPQSTLPTTFVTRADIEIPPLESGSYEVSWVGVGEDGHVMNGSFKFHVTTGQ
ncbi:MAG: copper resistance protein CopC [Alphaproteobacteria bacterium]|nr:copper resistance protein CopC [Alphaproteobacteria bacterium]